MRLDPRRCKAAATGAAIVLAAVLVLLSSGRITSPSPDTSNLDGPRAELVADDPAASRVDTDPTEAASADEAGSRPDGLFAVRPPVPGRYVYAYELRRGQLEPLRAELVVRVSVRPSSDGTDVLLVSGTEQTAIVDTMRWESDRVSLVSKHWADTTGEEEGCDFTPPLVLHRFPMRAGSPEHQGWQNASCSGEMKSQVLRPGTVRDARGRSWKAWNVIQQLRSSDLPSEVDGELWFAPNAGIEIRGRRTWLEPHEEDHHTVTQTTVLLATPEDPQ